MKKTIISILIAISGISYADQYNCDSNCLNGTDMSMMNNSTTGTQTTTANAFSYFTGTTCNGVNLMNNFSNGSQTVKEPNSTTCGYKSYVASNNKEASVFDGTINGDAVYGSITVMGWDHVSGNWFMNDVNGNTYTNSDPTALLDMNWVSW